MPMRRVGSGVLAVRALEAEEVALVPVAALLLVDEVQASVVEGPEPLVPAHLPQVVRAAAEVEPQDAEVVAVLGALDRGRCAAALFRPLLDDLVVRGGEAAALALRLLVGRGDLLGVLQ